MKPPVLPLGYNVLVEIIPVQLKTAGGIIRYSEKEKKREHDGCDIARIVAFGPIAFQAYAACNMPLL